MTWLQRYRLRHYLQNSIWVLPVGAIGLAMILSRFFHWLESEMGWVSGYDPDTMRAVLGTLAGAMFTFIVFLCSSLLLVVQLASTQLTPRILGMLFRDGVIKAALCLFVFTFAFAISALVHIDDRVPTLTADVAAYGSAVCLAFFVYLIDHVGKLLRPSGALQSVASQAHEVIEHVYPQRWKGGGSTAFETAVPLGNPDAVVTSLEVGVVLAFDVRGLVALAARHDCLVELAPQVGNFVAPGDPLFRIHGSQQPSPEVLRQSIALGPERTMEQDPAFAFRVLVDIAAKGLSPAINDPTTAVLALDRLHHLLRHVGNRRLEDERVRDRAGRVRLVYQTPDWEDFVTLAVTEIRQFGSTSIQVTRRLRAMLEDLLRVLPVQRQPPLERELALLESSVGRCFPEAEDQAFAGVGDCQGVGAAARSAPKSHA